MTGKVTTRSHHEHRMRVRRPSDGGLAAVDLAERREGGLSVTGSPGQGRRQQEVPPRSTARQPKKSVGCGAFFTSWTSPSPSTGKRPASKPRRKSEADKEAVRRQVLVMLEGDEATSEEEADPLEAAVCAAGGEARRHSEAAGGTRCPRDRSRSRSPLRHRHRHRHSVPLPGAALERSRRGQRRVLRLVDDLLVDIYRHRRPSVDSDSGSSVLPPRPHVDSRLHLRSVPELRALCSELAHHVSRLNAVLVRQLRRRDSLRARGERHCAVLTALLQAQSQKRSHNKKGKTGKKRVPVEPEAMNKAVKAISSPGESKISIREASKIYNVKFTTLVRHFQSFKQSGREEYSYEIKYDTKKVFNDTEELNLVEYIQTIAKMKYGLTKKLFRVLAYKYAVANNKKRSSK